ncbi:MAG: riboflavin synthase [Acidimicrobiales bacterium]
MFTGIVEEMGSLRDRRPAGAGARLVFDAPVVTEGASLGDSIAVNGCCLTVVELGPAGAGDNPAWWAADVVGETLRRTNLGNLRPGDQVNLERPVTLNGRIGGHLVQGHVDGVGRVLEPAPDLSVHTGAGLSRYIVTKGSVAVDGVSLTVVGVTGDSFSAAVIPHTLASTTLGRKVAGDPVNLEVDVIAKYAESLLHAGVETPYRSAGPTVSA